MEPDARAHAWTEAEVSALVAAFESTSLPVARWTHAAHVLVALWYARMFDEADALTAMRIGLRRYLAAVGGHARAYSEPLTAAWMKVIHAFAREHPGLAFSELAARALAQLGDSGYLGRSEQLAIRSEQLAALAAPFDDVFFAELVAWMRGKWWEQTLGRSDAQLDAWLRTVAQRALRSDIRRESDVRSFVDLELRHGPDFERKLAFAPAILRDDSLPGGAKMALLRQRANGSAVRAT